MTGAPALTVDTSSIRSALPAPASPRQDAPDTFQAALKRSSARNAQAKRPLNSGDPALGAPAIFHTASDLAAAELATPAQAKLAVAKAESGQSAPGAARKNEQKSSHNAATAPEADDAAEALAPAPASRSASRNVDSGEQMRPGDGAPARTQSASPGENSSAEGASSSAGATTHPGHQGTSSEQRNQGGHQGQTAPQPVPQGMSIASTPDAQGQAAAGARAAAPASAGTQPSGPTTASTPGAAVGAIKPASALQAADATPAAKPAPAQDSRQEKLQAQFGKGLAAALRQNGGTVTLRLKPEDLGDLKVRLNVQNGRVEARFEVSTDEAQAALGDSLKHLRSALEAKGLEVTRLDVHTVERRDPTSPGRDAPDSGPGFANHEHGAAGGDAGGHGRPGAESDRFGPARDLASGAAAEPEQERSPLPAWMSRTSAGISGGAPHKEPGLDAIA